MKYKHTKVKKQTAFHFLSVTSRRCSKAPAVNPDCSNHLVNIMRATVCLCDQPLCNGLFALANFTTSMNSRIFTNNNMLLTNTNQLNAVGNSAKSTMNNNKGATSNILVANHVDAKNNKENYMPLHDFNEQRIAAMLGTASQLMSGQCQIRALIISTLVMLWIITPKLKIDAHYT